MDKVSVVIVRSSFSIHGGVEKNALGVIQALLKKGINVQLLTWPDQHWPVSHPMLQIVPLGIAKGPRYLQALTFNRAVEKYLQRNRSTCIFSFDKVNTFTHLHAGGGTHQTFLKIKNAESNSISKNFRRLSGFHRYILSVEKKGFTNPRLAKIRCPSSLVKTDIMKDYSVQEAKLSVFPNGIDWHHIGTVYHDRRLRAEELARRHGLDTQRAYLLFLGSGFDRKGLDIAIRGVATLPADYGLIVVGKGHIALFRKLAKQLSVDHRLFFVGPQKDGWQYAALCKALVLPSRYEPFGIAPAEANAMGIPVLVSNMTGYMDQVQEGANGVILEFPATDKNVADAFSRLRKMIESPSCDGQGIRQRTYPLDYEIIMHRVIHEFLGIPIQNH